MPYVMALDVGGTFTDVILAADQGDQFWITKSASVPAEPARGFFGGVDKVLESAGIAPVELASVLHGSTVATNAILESKSARTGLVTTAGFRHVLEIGRADIPRHANLYSWVKPTRPVRPRHIYEIGERTCANGSVVEEPDENALKVIAREIKRDGLAAIAILFLHSYANPANEKRAAKVLRDLLPDVAFSLSSDVLPVFREYERGMATVLNAGVQPIVGPYIGELKLGLGERGIEAPLLVMKSNGGVFPPEIAARQPIHLALSGPAAGAKGAAYVGKTAGFNDLITIDMGGTSTDVALIRDGEVATSSTSQVAEFPLALPIIDIHTLGAGGGSIARISATNALVVGPESAGARPGPAAYALGGTRPTVTDANLVLGRIPPSLLDGEIALDSRCAAEAIQRDVAQPLGISVEEAARGIVEIVDNNMIGALKVMSVERGLNPREFALCAFGGAGPVHATRLMRLLGTPRLLVPRHPGILCAIGLTSADFRYDFVLTCMQRAGDYDTSIIADTYQKLLAQADGKLAEDGIALCRRRFSIAADLRYAQQGMELTVDLGTTNVSDETIDALCASFHRRHAELYTFADESAAVEIVNLRVVATGAIDRIQPATIERAPEGDEPLFECARWAALDCGELQEVPVFRREALLSGHAISGPAIVDQLDSTVCILAGQHAFVDDYANLIVEEAAA
ncbi:MAG: hydantoinase/oxoprolinase family protein [Hyphomicrobiaceae bacterium]